MANKKNLAVAELASGISISATTATVKAGQGARLPATPFFATLTPVGVLSTPDNSEIISVTAVSTDTLTIVRAQKGSTAYAFVADAILGNGIYAEDVDIAGNIDAATSKTTPVDADELGIVDSAASNVLKKLTWANLKATLKTYFDAIYQPLAANLTAIAGLTSAADKIPYFTGSGTASLLTRDTDGTLAANSDTVIATQKAVKTLVGNQNPMKFKLYSLNLTVGGNANGTGSMGAMAAPSGYTYIGAIPLNNGYSDTQTATYSQYGGNMVVFVHNYYGSSLNTTYQCLAVWVQTSYYTTNSI